MEWYDNSIATMASNCLGAAPLKASRWWFQAEKVFEVQQPHVVSLHNKYMGGFDQIDHKFGKLSCHTHGEMVVATNYMIFMKCHNAWLLFRRAAKEQEIATLDFLGLTPRVAMW